MTDYNPYILGYVEQGGRSGDVWLPLQEAIETFGDLPSRYGLLPELKVRRQRRTLNLALGTAINHILRRVPDLKRQVFEFYDAWHRDWATEFGIDTKPLFNRCRVDQLMSWIDSHRGLLETHESFPIRDEILSKGLIRRDVLNSISDEQLLNKAQEILVRKRDQKIRDRVSGAEIYDAEVRKLRVRELLRGLHERVGMLPGSIDRLTASIYTDEISHGLAELCRIKGEPGRGLESLSGEATEFTFATRDLEMLRLGSDIGDCTAVPFRQVDAHTENIYWTLYPWMLDRNYLILKVHHQGGLVMKVHLLPLVTYESGKAQVFLAVDAIETAIVMRRDIPGENRLSETRCRDVLESVRREILRIADAMGVQDVYLELFSNNPIVRGWLEGFEKTYLDVGAIHKVDELEDIFNLARSLSAAFDEPAPDHVFMEIQFRNTQLMSHQTPKTNIKGFATLRTGSVSGFAMSKVIGV